MPPAKHRTLPAGARALARPLAGPAGVATTIPVVDRVEMDRLDLWLWERGERVNPSPGTRVFFERDSAVPAWLIRWHELPPSQNELMRRFSNVHVYNALVRSWKNIIWGAALQAAIPKAGGRRRVEIKRFIRNESYRLDRGNLVGGCKPILDAAVQCGLLLDDREEHLDDHYRQPIDATERVEILISNI